MLYVLLVKGETMISSCFRAQLCPRRPPSADHRSCSATDGLPPAHSTDSPQDSPPSPPHAPPPGYSPAGLVQAQGVQSSLGSGSAGWLVGSGCRLGSRRGGLREQVGAELGAVGAGIAVLPTHHCTAFDTGHQG